jgi:hypothetical protein
LVARLLIAESFALLATCCATVRYLAASRISRMLKTSFRPSRYRRIVDVGIGEEFRQQVQHLPVAHLRVHRGQVEHQLRHRQFFVRRRDHVLIGPVER